MSDKTERRANVAMRFAFRTFINVGVIWFLNQYFPNFFVLQGGLQAIAIVSLTLTVLNIIVVPLLNVLSLPIKLFAWLVAFLLVNTAAVWITVWFVNGLEIVGVSLSIEGGIVGWVIAGTCVGIGNWLVRAIVK